MLVAPSLWPVDVGSGDESDGGDSSDGSDSDGSDPIPGPVDNWIGAGVDTGITVIQDGARAGADITGGTIDFVGGGTADLVGDVAGGAADTAATVTWDVGEFIGEGATGASDTAEDVASDAGGAVGGFWSGALNAQTVMLAGIVLIAVYVLANSEAGEAAGTAATAGVPA
ncbi:hypothetical protein [Halorhabdus amylolytica]|uniref:hypothetical protein n=1 Tax=Halorhabdus amylolytica TaxID=2559573 RepID=UPI0010AAC5EB|nr:hypothetical protein [Halorhabdus amylolytica]